MGDLLIRGKKELRRKSIFDLLELGQLTQLDASKRLHLSYRQTKRAYQRWGLYQDRILLKNYDSGISRQMRLRINCCRKAS